MQSNNTHQCEPPSQHLAITILPPLLIIELLLGLPGNIMALWVFYCHLQSLKPNVVFLLNLVMADFLLLVSLPFRIDLLLRKENWVFGSTWCGINLFMLAINRSASISFMTTVAVDRYFKVVHPHHKINFISVRQAVGITCFIWTVVILLRIPLLTNDLIVIQNNHSLCRSFNHYDVLPLSIILHYIVYIAEFFLPLAILVFCSVQITLILRRCQSDKKLKRAILSIMVIVGIFIFCFFPGIAIGLTVLVLENQKVRNCYAYTLSAELFSLSIGFTYLNSALDPVIYCFSSSVFQNMVKRIISQLTGGATAN